MSPLAIAIGALAVLLFGHALFTLALMLYAWDSPERLRATAGTPKLAKPKFSFTVLLPARGEEAVIAGTIERLWLANYPRNLLQIVVICQRDDPATIAAVRRQIDALGGVGIRLVIYDEPPFNKPHALTVGYQAATKKVIAVFDAEDDVHPDIFRVVNTVMLARKAGVVQAGVQLMNFRDHWFAPFNCLEYFFHYRSRMHFNARVGMVPLGGNTVFIRRTLIDAVGGWDMRCLAEDADIGVRISALGKRVSVIYESSRVTREETPHSAAQFIRQRTRWHQGFLQILGRRDWMRIPGRRRRLLAALTLGQPILDALMLLYVLLMPLSLILLDLPDLIALLTFLPLYGVLLQLAANIVAIGLFARTYDLRVPLRVRLAMPFTFLPFQWMLGFSAWRALTRHALGRGEWEKTEHRGAHRPLETVPAPAAAGLLMQESS